MDYIKYNNNEKKSGSNISINNLIKLKKNDIKYKNKENENETGIEIEMENLEKEFTELSVNKTTRPKNYGNLWNDNERNIIINYMKKNNYCHENNLNLFDEKIIQKISKKIERSDYAVKEEIKKMIAIDYIKEFDYAVVCEKYNIPESYIKLIIKSYLEKNEKKIILPMEIENKILKIKIENIKLKKELKKLIKNKIYVESE